MNTVHTSRNVEHLLERQGWVRALARSLVFDRDRADDAAQQAWLALLERPPRSAESLRAWLASVIRRFSRDARRGDDRRREREAVGARRETLPSAADVIEEESARREVVKAVLDLPEAYRTVVLLRYFEGLSPRDVARRLGIPLETARTRLKRALASLRERFEGRVDGEGRSSMLVLLAPLARRLPHAAPAAGGAAILWKAVTLMSAKKAIVAAAVLLVAGLVVREGLKHRAETKTARGAEQSSIATAAPVSDAARSTATIIGARSTSGPAFDSGLSSSGAIRGRVVGPDGRGVAGARVVALPEGASAPGTPLSIGDAPATATETDGSFALPPAKAAPLTSVVAEARGFPPAVRRSVVPGEPLLIRLDRPNALAGVVMDVDRKPIPNARVSYTGWLDAAYVERESITGEDGSYRLENVPVRSRDAANPVFSRLETRAEGFARATRLIRGSDLGRPDPDGRMSLDVVLVRGAAVRGRVLDVETLEPIPAATVCFQSSEAVVTEWESLLKRPRSAPPLTETRSGSDGSFVLDRLPANGFDSIESNTGDSEIGEVLGTVVVSASGYATTSRMVPLLDEGDVQEVEIRCWPAATIRGRVVDEAGRPVAEISIAEHCEQRSDREWKRIRTGPDGRYVIENVYAPSGSPALTRITATPFNWNGSGTEASVDIPVRAGETTDAPDLVIHSHAEAMIRIVSPDGAPIPFAEIWVRRESTQFGTFSRQADAEGTFHLTSRSREDGSPEEPFTLFAHAPGYAPAIAPEFAPSVDEPPEVRVVLIPEHRLAGTVRWANGEPVAAAQVFVATTEATLEEAFPGDGHFYNGPPRTPLCVGGGAILRSGFTDDDGSFSIGGLPPGPWHVAAVARTGRSREDLSILVLARIAGVDESKGRVAIELSENPPVFGDAMIVGTVVDAATGKPVPSPRVSLKSDAARASACVTSPGRFRAEDIQPGIWSLRVTADGYAPLEQPSIEIPRQTAPVSLKLALHRGASVHGTVRGEGIADPRAVDLVFTDFETLESQKVRLGEDGSFEATGLWPGRFRVELRPHSRTGGTARGMSLRPAEALVIESPDEEARLDLEAIMAVYLTFKVEGTVPDPMPISTVEIQTIEGRSVAIQRLPVDDRQRYFQLPPGRYRARFLVVGQPDQQQEIELEEGRNAEMSFAYP